MRNIPRFAGHLDKVDHLLGWVCQKHIPANLCQVALSHVKYALQVEKSSQINVRLIKRLQMEEIFKITLLIISSVGTSGAIIFGLSNYMENGRKQMK